MKTRNALYVAVAVVVGAGALTAHQQHAAGAAPDQAKIKSAMSAAPAAVSAAATIIDVSADGTIRTIHKGTNNYTCMPDNPETPGPDPMCGDQNAMEWVQAWMGKKTPPPNKVGFMYMLAGGTDASNTDPFAQKPQAGNNWIETGPHVMVVGAKGAMEGYPRAPKPDTKVPYVMWAGTPYEHLMIPVK